MARMNPSGRGVGRPRLLPVMIGVTGVALALKLGGFAGNLDQVLARAEAQEAGAAQQAPAPEANSPEDGTDLSFSDTVAGADSNTGAPLRNSTEMSLIADLRAQREALDERERRVDLREQLLASTEQRIDKKLEELRMIQTRIESLVVQHEEQENDQIRNIVKVYEAMRPKDAGPIFQRLDLEIQAEVAVRMREANMAAMMAEMNPESAKILTSHLARRTPLPDASQLVGDDTNDS